MFSFLWSTELPDVNESILVNILQFEDLTDNVFNLRCSS